MLAFTILLLLIFGFSFVFEKKGKKAYNAYLIICFILLVLLRVCIKWIEWGDNDEYYDAFIQTSKHTLIFFIQNGWSIDGFKSEPGWVFYNWLCSHISSDYYFFLLITAIISLSGYIYAVKKYLAPQFMWFPIYLIVFGPYLQSFYVLRQHLAMGLMLFAYKPIVDRKLLKFLIIVVIGSYIHQTCLFIIPLYIIYGLKDKKWLLLAIGIYTIIMVSSIAILSEYFINLGFGAQKYLKLDEDNASNLSTAYLLIGTLTLRVLIVRKSILKSGVTKLLTITLTLGCINAVAGAGQTEFMSRLNMYYSEILFLILPDTISYIKKIELRLLLIICFTAFEGFLFFKHYSIYSVGSFVWQ